MTVKIVDQVKDNTNFRDRGTTANTLSCTIKKGSDLNGL